MKLLLLGKTGGITRWVEDVAADLRRAGHGVHVLPYRDIRLNKTLERCLMAPAIGAPLARAIARRMRRLAPDLVLVFGPFHWLPPALFAHLAQLPGRPPLVAWIGDVFSPQAAAVADLFDVVAYTDTGLLARHRAFGFRAHAAFVPLAATLAEPMGAPSAGRGLGADVRDAAGADIAFVATPTPQRRALLARVTEPVAIYGPGWPDRAGFGAHRCDARRVEAAELAAIYRSCRAVLNIRHEDNVIDGLNQRHFAPYVYGTPVLTDAQADLAECFDPGTEILVYRDAAELNALCAALRRDPAWARAVGLAGQRRVLAAHSYVRRVQQIADMVGVCAA